MFKLAGIYNEASVFATTPDETAMAQIQSMLDNPAFEGMKIAVQADCHAGVGSVIGFTGTLKDKVIPNLVGVDIGCGVLACKLARPYCNPQRLNLKAFDDYIHQFIPSGFRGHPDESNMEQMTIPETERMREALSKLHAKIPLDSFWSKIGTLGGGNHFIELDKDELGDLWLVIHSGSRNFGLQVAKWHQNRAKEKNPGFKDQEFLCMDDGGREYLEDMFVAQEYAKLNRVVMTRIIAMYFGGAPWEASIESVHNYISERDHVVRKGAISAYAGQGVVIPMNMAFGTIIGAGKGSEAHNQSAPHGAGRAMGRKEAKRKLNMADFQKSMFGIYTTTANEETLDEAPMAYKDPEEIMSVLGDTVEVLKPVYNFKDATKEKAG